MFWRPQQRITTKKLGDGFKYCFDFHPENRGNDPIWRLRIFFKWVETTNQITLNKSKLKNPQESLRMLRKGEKPPTNANQHPIILHP